METQPNFADALVGHTYCMIGRIEMRGNLFCLRSLLQAVVLIYYETTSKKSRRSVGFTGPNPGFRKGKGGGEEGGLGGKTASKCRVRIDNR